MTDTELDQQAEAIARQLDRRLAFVEVTTVDAVRGPLEAGVIVPGPAVLGGIEDA